ncbi:MAG: sulfite exporter TauE/SafE family protein [Clostridia bacterium]|nr:sulfite exporter TauE/SafE family protein [Clostridia bacterium]
MGMGGGTILILCLSLFLGKDQHVAQGANLVFFIPTSLVSIFMNIKQKLIKWKTGLVVSLFGAVGAVIGAKISVNLDTNKLKLYFGIFLLLIAVFEVYSLFFKKEKTK